MKTIYKPGVGMHIRDACREAVSFAQEAGESQTFTFNDISVTAYPDSDPDALVSAFSAKQEADYKAWQESPEGKKQAEDRRLELICKQATHEALVADLPNVLAERRDALMRWLSSYAEVADDIGVAKNFPVVVEALQGAGYKNNEATGLPREEYAKPAIMAAYIAGQALACMIKGMPPHPMTMTFVERYFKLPTP